MRPVVPPGVRRPRPATLGRADEILLALVRLAYSIIRSLM